MSHIFKIFNLTSQVVGDYSREIIKEFIFINLPNAVPDDTGLVTTGPLVGRCVTGELIVNIRPHEELGSELSIALACVTEPCFNQQVPPLKLVNDQ